LVADPASWQQTLRTFCVDAGLPVTEPLLPPEARVRQPAGDTPADLTPEQQDGVLRDLERPDQQQETELAKAEATLYDAPVEPALQQTSAEVDLGFVPLLALHTRQGFYADPIYGGNRNRVGWDVIGFPGPTSLAEVHSGRYSTLDYFADDREHPIAKEEAS
jgi:gluconate 2-dehydrogenase gamma chain